MRKMLNHKAQELLPSLVLAGFVLIAGVTIAQQVPMGRFTDFSLPEFYEPPNETQMKSLVQGAEAMPQAEGRILIKQLKLQTFREDGAAEIILEARDCVYDPAARQADSDGPLAVRTADQQFYLEGTGFLWKQTNSSLTISNRVHTVIRRTGNTSPKK